MSELTPGESALILEFSDENLAVKLIEMGCLPGEKIKFEKVAPMGCPIIFSIGEHKLSMRRSEADKIIVR